MRRFSKWPIRPARAGSPPLPDSLLTVWAGGPAVKLPPVVALLLPNAGGAQDLLADLDDTRRPAALGLFLSDPNLVAARLSRQIARHTGWVCNFPSVGQHEHEFRRYLAEVDLDHGREMRVLGDLRAAGLSTIATVSAERDMDAALASRPAALLVVPPVPEYTAGPAPLARREKLERAVAARAPDHPVIGLRDPDEPAEGLAARLLPPETISP